MVFEAELTNLEPNTTYELTTKQIICKRKDSETESVGKIFAFKVYNNGNQIENKGNAFTTSGNKTDIYKIIFAIIAGDFGSLEYVKIEQLMLSNVRGDYEPYGYLLDIKVTGKNLFDIEKAKEKSNWTTSANGAGFVEIAVYVGTGSTVTVSNNTKINNPGLYYYGVALKSSEDFKYFICYPGYPNSKDTHTFTATEDYIYVRCNKTSLNEVIGVCGGLQIEIGASRTDFESYKEQTITITSDRPLTKWDRLVEQGGQIGWLYKHKIIEDFSTLVKDTEPIYGNDGGKYFAVSLQNASLNYDRSKIYSEVGIYGKDNKKYYIPQPMVASTIIHVSDTDTIMIAKEHMHYKVVYETVDSEFIPLPQSEQNAIRALTTYYPTTVITVDGGELDPDIKVTYRKEI